MFATSVRVRPCSARSSPRSVGRFTVTTPSACSIFMRAGTCCCSVPSGPATATRAGSIVTVTPSGTSMGALPILLIPLPDEGHHCAADAALLRGAARDQTGRGREDRDAHPAEHARKTVFPGVDPAARLRHALQAGDDPLAVAAELEVDDQGIEGFALLHVVVADVALLLEEAGDLDLHPRARHGCLLVQRLVGVADAGEHVCDRIGQHRFSPTSSTSSCRESRPGAPARGGRSGRGRTCGRPRADGRTGYSACSCAPCTSGVAVASRRARSSPLLIPSFAVGRERQAECPQQREGVLVVLGARRDRHVEPADLLDVVVVDLREDELLADAEREVAAPVERARVEAAEVADLGQRDRDEAVEELVHPRAAQRHARTDGHPLAQLELRNRLAGAPDLGALAGDRGQLLDGGVEQLRLGLRLADAHVERDLLDARRLHDRAEPELLLEARPDLILVLLLQARRVRVGYGAHVRLISSPHCLQTRTRTDRSLTTFSIVPTRVGLPHTGQTTITFETGSGAANSTIPPGVMPPPPKPVAFWIGRGRRCRLTTLMFSTTTRPCLGSASSTRPSLPASLPRRMCTTSPFFTFMV